MTVTVSGQSADAAADMAGDDLVTPAAHRARAAARVLATAARAAKDAALLAMADAVETRAAEIVAANDRDVDGARAGGSSATSVDRLRLDTARVTAMAGGLRQVAALPDPVGEVVQGSTLPNGLEVRQLRVPLGVVAVVYEGRPNVTADAAGLCLKSGNAVLLRGSGSALESNRALVSVLRDALDEAGLPADAVQLVEGGRESVRRLMRARGLVDLLVPRGGAGLIRSIVEGSTVPVVETGVGNCHVYVDRDADLGRAVDIVINAKAQRPSVCNAAETVLVHADVADSFLPVLLPALSAAGVTVHGDERVAARDAAVVVATAQDWDTEYLSLDLAIAVVDDLDTAIAHVQRHSTGHTEAILTGSQQAARRFVAEVDAAAVIVNASTRFTDGAELGYGAEIGISTQKLHARGPMGLRELTSTKLVVTGEGHIRD